MISVTLDPFSDPAPYRASGLQRSTCACGATAYVDAGYAGPVACGSCWRAYRGAGRAAPAPVRGAAMPGARPRSAAALARGPAYRVLTPARDAEPADDVPTSAYRLARLATAEGWRVRLTYALAEELETRTLVRTLAVRMRWSERAAVACWRDGRAAGAVVTPMRRVGLAELEAVLTGRPYTPPVREPAVVGPCPQCARPVRWTKGFVPYAHRRPDGEPCS